jgi:hypothetical protein
MRIFYIALVSIFFIGCGNDNNSNTIVAGANHSALVSKINEYRIKGVTCSEKEYKPTFELTIVNVSTLINKDEYVFNKYDYDTVLTISKDENLSSLFDESINCDYLFGEFTDVVSYDEPTLFLGGNVDEDQ